jgi:hypothetical protein
LEANTIQEVQKTHQQQELQATADPMTKFMYALKAKESKRQYPRRFKTFLDFLKLEGSMNEQANQLLLVTKSVLGGNISKVIWMSYSPYFLCG